VKALVLALALAAPAGAFPVGAKEQPYGILIIAYGVGGPWRKDLMALRDQLKGHALEIVEKSENASNSVGVQKAIDRLTLHRVGKIVAVPLAALAESPALDEDRYLFGVREDPPSDRPDARQKEMKPLHSEVKSSLVLPGAGRRLSRLKSAVPLVLTETIDKSPVLAEILADRAKALSRDPSREAILLVGAGPRSDEALKAWKASAQAVADKVQERGGFRTGAVAVVRAGVRAGQQDKDREELRAIFRTLSTEGRIVAVPLAPDGTSLERLFKRELGNAAYRWDGKGLIGDRRLVEWVRAKAEAGAKLPDSRQYRDGASFGAPSPFGGKR